MTFIVLPAGGCWVCHLVVLMLLFAGCVVGVQAPLQAMKKGH
jgi:uncharacterized membrane protein SpoIIM required for sporulation